MVNVFKYVICAFLWLTYFSVNAQEFPSKIQGRLLSTNADVTAIHVSNISSQRGTITDIDGYFIISAQINDTLVFSAVQFKRKELIVTAQVLETKLLLVVLEPSLTQLEEVVVMPYNLTGDLGVDIKILKTGLVKTASTEGLPNAHVIPKTQSQRKRYTARTWDAKFYLLAFTSKVDPLLNYFSGRTKNLNERIKRDENINLINEVRQFYEDSLYITALKIPYTEINNFIYYCEVDSSFVEVVSTADKLKLWDFMKEKSLIFRKNNGLR